MPALLVSESASYALGSLSSTNTSHQRSTSKLLSKPTRCTTKPHPAVAGKSGEDRYRPKGVFGKGFCNSKNVSEIRQKCVKMGLVLFGKEERSKMRQKCVKIASEMRQKCAEHLWGRTPFGRYREEGEAEPSVAITHCVGCGHRTDSAIEPTILACNN